MDINSDYFALFGLPRSFTLDGARLGEAYLRVQKQAHPDRFVQAGDSERRVAMQWATRINDAYRTLRSPLDRATYLLGLSGHTIDRERNTAMNPDFLAAQIEWRETVDEARRQRDKAALLAMQARLQADLQRQYERLACLLDEKHVDNETDCLEAADIVRQSMFLDKLAQKIEDILCE